MSGAKNRKASRDAAVERSRQVVRGAIEKFAPELFDGIKGAGLSETGLTAITTELEQGATLGEVKKRRRQLRAELRALADFTQGAVALPGVEVQLKRPKSSFRPSEFSRLPEIGRIRKALVA